MDHTVIEVNETASEQSLQEPGWLLPPQGLPSVLQLFNSMSGGHKNSKPQSMEELKKSIKDINEGSDFYEPWCMNAKRMELLYKDMS